jgi:hypothetical protein
MISAQPLSARAEILQAEPWEISNLPPRAFRIHTLERRHQMSPYWMAKLEEIKQILGTLSPITENNLRTTVNENVDVINGFIQAPDTFRFEAWDLHIQQAIGALQQLVVDHERPHYGPQLLRLRESSLGEYIIHLLDDRRGNLGRDDRREAQRRAQALLTMDIERRQHWQEVLGCINSLRDGGGQNINILNRALHLMRVNMLPGPVVQ